MLNRELAGWYKVSFTGWVVLSAYIFSIIFALSEVYTGNFPGPSEEPAIWMSLVLVLTLFAKMRRSQLFSSRKGSTNGFSLVELIIVISIIGILSSITMSMISRAKEKAYFARAKTEFRSIELALELYLEDHFGVYPADVSRSVPPGLEEYISIQTWPDAPYPNSVYDWENWTIGGEKVYQISLRFCPIGGPLSACTFPNEDWAENFGVNSALFYCFEGACRSHSGNPYDYPGYCVNCTGDDIIRGD